MALELKEKYKGVEANYWKIIDYHQDALNNTTKVNLALYLDKATRDESKDNFLKIETFYFDGVDYEREDLYLKIKDFGIYDDINDITIKKFEKAKNN